MRNLFLTAALAAAFLPSAAWAAPDAPSADDMTCPIGGAAFAYKPMLPPPAIGSRPDGKPYGGAMPTPLPECPDNGLVLYKDYSPEEVDKLTPLVTSPDYQALRSETQYYRAYWLMKQMGLGPERYLWALLQASWEADTRPELRARYFAELADESAKAEARPNDINWIGMEGRAIDALRELGRFDEASARLAKLPLDALQPGAGKGGAAARLAQQRAVWLTYFQQIKVAIERQDASPEPLDMIPRTIALGYCIDRADSLDANQKGFCQQEQAAVAAMKSEAANTEVDIRTLSRPRSESGR